MDYQTMFDFLTVPFRVPMFEYESLRYGIRERCSRIELATDEVVGILPTLSMEVMMGL
jgi:hypothetical protein